MTIKKLKQKIAAILGITILSAGGVSININIQTEEFYEQLADGKLYVNAFNQGAYKEVRSELINKVDIFIGGGEPLTYQALGTYLDIVSYEAKKDTFTATDNVYKEQGGHLVVTGTKEVERTGWKVSGGTDKEFLENLNKKLKTKL